MGEGEENGQGGTESSEDDTDGETAPLRAGTVGSPCTGLEGRLLNDKYRSKVQITFDTIVTAQSTEKKLKLRGKTMKNHLWGTEINPSIKY